MPSSKDPSQIVQPGQGPPAPGAGSSSTNTLPIYGGGPMWADGTTNPPTTVNGQLTKIIVDLTSLGGSARIFSSALVGANNTINQGTLWFQLTALKDSLNLEYSGGGAWADASTNPATVVEAQLDKIISDLGGTGGSAKVGAAAIVGTFSTIAAGSVQTQLVALKQVANIDGTAIAGASGTIAAADLQTQLVALKQAANIEYAGGGVWRDASTNPATLVETQLDKIITDLTSQSSGTSGAEKIGCAGIVGALGTIAFGTIYSVMSALKVAGSIEYGGGGTWADGTTNPAVSVEGQLDKVISDLASTSGGSAKVGSAAIVGTSNTIAAAGLHTQLAALKLASNIEYSGGGTWADASTNPATVVESQLDKIISDLGGSGGAAKIGAATTGNFTGTSVQADIAQLTQTTASDDGAKRIGTEVVGGFQAGELTVRAQLDGLDTRKFDKAGGTITGSFALSSATEKIGLGSRSISRVQQSPMIDQTSGLVTISGGSNVAANGGKYQTLLIPHGATLTSVQAWINPPNTGMLPTLKPNLTVRRRDLTSGALATLGAQVDPSANFGIYEAHHAISLTGLVEVVDRTKYYYYAEYNNEDTSTVPFYGCICVYTLTSMDDGY